MVFSELLIVAAGVGFTSALAVALVALHMGAVTGRLRLVCNLFGLGVVIAAAACGLAMIVSWLMTERLELLILAALPLLLAGSVFNLLTRRHMPWYEALGAAGGKARWKGLWDEMQADGRSGRPERMARAGSVDAPAGPEPATSGARTGGTGAARTFSFGFQTTGSLGKTGAGVLGPMLASAAHGLSGKRISVVPTELHLHVVLDAGGGRSHLDAFRHRLTVRRGDGGPLVISVASDLPFIELHVHPGRPDGSYPIGIGLLADRLVPGPFSGTISLRTGDPARPHLTVPVTGTIERPEKTP